MHRQARRCLESTNLFAASSFATDNDGADSVRAPRLSFRNSPNMSLLMTADNCSARYVAHSCLSANTAVPRFCPRGLHLGVQCTCSARDLGIVPKMIINLWRLWRRGGERRATDENRVNVLAELSGSRSSPFQTQVDSKRHRSGVVQYGRRHGHPKQT